jgi:soluble lytic murein transglycosylase-like protein
VGAPMSWQTVVDLDVAFARSRRRATSRRARSARRAKVDRGIRAATLALIVLSAVAVATRFVDTAPAKSNATATRPAPAPAPAQVVRACNVKTPYGRAFRSAAHETGLPLALLVAVAWEESRMDPRAQSGAGAQGLLQLMPTTAPALGPRMYDPRANIRAGARYLSRLVDRFGGDVELALAAYNAGPTAVERLGRAPSLETLRYTKNVEMRAVSLAACRG